MSKCMYFSQTELLVVLMKLALQPGDSILSGNCAEILSQ